MYDDLQASYKLPKNLLDASVSLGVNNVFDQGAPVCLSCSLNGYDASNYDLPGRYVYAETTVKF
jgi:iron complex outermembrane receptor protein